VKLGGLPPPPPPTPSADPLSAGWLKTPLTWLRALTLLEGFRVFKVFNRFKGF
jgi:hypothetical protein